MKSKCELVNTGQVKRKGRASIEWYKDKEPVYYCLGYTDPATDEPLPECTACKMHVCHADGDWLKWMRDMTKHIVCWQTTKKSY